MTALTFIPAFLMMATSFTRIIIVFAILRQAIGLQQTPSNQILVGIALFLTFFVMAPVFDRINESALQPYLNEEVGSLEALQRASLPCGISCWPRPGRMIWPCSFAWPATPAMNPPSRFPLRY